ncbi:MAG: hypothetical protein RLZZ352_808 [Pseudomonadota bacterium]|jgi:hypothetical protein
MSIKLLPYCIVCGLITPSALLAQDGIILKGATTIGIESVSALRTTQSPYRVSIAQFALNGNPLPDLKEMVVRWDGALLLPVNTLVELAEGAVLKKTPETFSFYLNSPNDVVEVSPTQGTLTFKGKVYPFQSGDWTVLEGAPYISYNFVSDILKIQVTYDEQIGTIDVLTRERWPSERRSLREQQWRRLENAAAEASAAAVPLVLDYKATGAPQADIAISAYNSSQGSGSDFFFNFVSEALYMTNTLAMSGSLDNGVRQVRMQTGRTDPAGSVFGIPNLYKFELGDVIGSAMPMIGSMAPGRGLLLRAAPLDQYDEYERTDIVGQAPPGWDVELYASGTLLAVVKAQADGLYRFINVPLRYGINNFRAVMYGPAGQQRQEFFQKRVGQSMLREGETHAYSYLAQPNTPVLSTRYSTVTPSKDWVGSARVDYGLASQVTLSTFLARSQYADWVSGTGLAVDKLADYAGFSARSALTVGELDAGVVKQMDGSLGKYANLIVPVGDYSLATSLQLYGDRFFSAGNRYENEWIQRRLRLRANSPFNWFHQDGFVTASLEKMDLENNGRVTLSTLSYMHALSNAYLNHNLESENFKRTVLGVNRDSNKLRYRGFAAYRYEDINFRAEVGYLLRGFDQGFEFVALNADWQHDNGVSLNGNYTYRSNGTSTAQLRLNRKVKMLIWSLGVGKSTNSDYSFTASVGMNFGVGYSPSIGTIYSEHARTPFSQLSTRLYHDVNRNGRFDQDVDRPVPNISAIVNNRRAENASNQDGLLHIDKVSTTRRQTIQLNSDDLAEYFLVAKVPGFQISARPGQEHHLPFDLMEMGEISGLMIVKERDGSKFPVSGVRLQVVNEDGVVVQETNSLSDGFYIFDKVYAGKWTIRLHPEQLPIYEDICMDEVHVELTDEELVLSNVNLLAERRPKKAQP